MCLPIVALQASGMAFVAYCDASAEKESTGFKLPKFLKNFFGGNKKDDGDAKDSDGEAEAEPEDEFAAMVASLPVIALDEVRKHTQPDDIWVTYEGVVYDVTSFVEHHPGGKEL